MFIVFEGIDGAGKTTQAKLLSKYLKDDEGHDVVLTSEPYKLDKTRRHHYLDYFADRKKHIDEVIKPALKAGKIVISDRYHLSTLAYQSPLNKMPLDQFLDEERVLDNTLVDELSQFLKDKRKILGNMILPKLNIIFYAKTDEILKKWAHRANESWEDLIRPNEFYKGFERKFGTIICTQDGLSIEEIHEDIKIQIPMHIWGDLKNYK